MFSRSLLRYIRHARFSNGHVCRSFNTFSMNFTAASRRSRFGKKLVRNELDDTEKEVTEDKSHNGKNDINNLNDKSSVLELISKKMDETFEKEINSKSEKKTKSIKIKEPEKKGDQKKNNTNKEAEKIKNPAIKPDNNKNNKEFKRNNRFSKDANTNNKLEASSKYKVKVKNKKKPKISPSGDRYKLDIPTFLSVANFATILRVRVPELLEKLQDLGFENMSNEYILDGETASLIAEEYGFEVNQDDNLGADLFPSELTTDASKLKPRSPIVTIMGHVDHGKTTILDYLRKSSIVKGEFGGITQHIGAFVVQTPVSNKKITFLDTPGHAAFLRMRERGANMTDIIILVVAAEDSIKPQTVEAIKHAKNAGVPVIVAVNKCDKEQADPDKVVADLSSQGVDVEDYGGDTPVVRISAKTGMGMKDLEETIVTVADLLELKTEEKVPVEGWVLESQVKKGLGNVATFLIKKGQLKPGDVIVAGTTFCKAKVMKDENGKRIKVANTSQPVELAGWKSIPEAGEFGIQSRDEAYAKKVIANREKRKRMMDEASQVSEMNSSRLKAAEEAKRDEKIRQYQLEGLNLEEIKELEPELFEGEEEKTKLVNFIIKADVSGSAEAVKQSIEGLGNNEVQSKVLFEEVGAPTESDISRAKISDAQILAFNVKVPKDILNSASKEGVEIKEFNVIYHLIEEVLKTLTSKLSPIYETKVVSKVTVKQLFEISLKGKDSMVIAGSRVIEGTFKRNAVVRVMRKGELFYEGKIKQLKVEKNDVNEVKNGADCGVALENEPKIIEGDIIEAIERVPIERHL